MARPSTMKPLSAETCNSRRMVRARTALAMDYARMVEDGLLLEDAEPFEALIERCADIAERANHAEKGMILRETDIYLFYRS